MFLCMTEAWTLPLHIDFVVPEAGYYGLSTPYYDIHKCNYLLIHIVCYLQEINNVGMSDNGQNLYQSVNSQLGQILY